jgi:hypothetical protein
MIVTIVIVREQENRTMYRLEKYNGKNRCQCPRCGAVREFVRYVDGKGEPLGAEVGRCNRESKCGYHYTPRQYFIDNPILQIDRNELKPSPGIKANKVGDLSNKIDLIPPGIFKQSLGAYDENGFVQFLLSRFSVSEARQVLRCYFIGTWAGARTVFWQIDINRQVRTVKLISYDPIAGKRRKDRKPSWVHAELKRRGVLAISFNLEQSLFGEHLLTIEPDKPVAIVESEKTAVVASLFMPQYLWLATGGANNLRPERLSNLMKGRRVVLFPDSSKFEAWSAKVEEGRRVFGVDVRVSDLLERRLTSEEKREDYDIVDFLLEERRRSKC